MRYLHLFEDGSLSQTDEEPLDEDCQCVDEGTLTIIRCEKGEFQSAVVTSDEVPDDEDKDDGDTHTEWTVERWVKI